VVIDDVEQSCKPTIVIKATGLVGPEPPERRRAVAFVRRTFRLEIVDADFRRRVHVPARFGEGGRNMAHSALRLTIEYGFAPRSSRAVETTIRRRGCCDAELIQL